MKRPSKGPGARLLTVIPCEPNSLARDIVKPTTLALEAA